MRPATNVATTAKKTHALVAVALLERLGPIFDDLAADDDFNAATRVLVLVVVADALGRAVARAFDDATADDAYANALAEPGDDDDDDDGPPTVIFRPTRASAVFVLATRFPEVAFALRTAPLPGFAHAVVIAARGAVALSVFPARGRRRS